MAEDVKDTREVMLREGVPFEEYAKLDCVTGGFLFTLIERSPAHAIAEKENPPDSDVFTFGSAFHTTMLEPDEVERRYIAKPNGMSFSTTAGKAWRAQQTKEIITAKQWDDLRGMRDALFEDELAGPIMREEGVKEVSAMWQDQTSLGRSLGMAPVWCKGRPDFIPDGRLVDLKTTVDARPHAFNRQAEDLGYYFKMAWYLDGIEEIALRQPELRLSRPQETFLIAIEKEKPHAVNTFLVPRETLAAGKMYREAAMYRYRECLQTGVWTKYGKRIYPVTLKPWKIEHIYGGHE